VSSFYQFEDVLKSEPGNFDAHYHMAKAYQALGQKQVAKKLFNQINGYLDSGELCKSLSK
jgi:Tfp pilus assembly protein PilF